MHRAVSPESKAASPNRSMTRALPVYSDFSHMSMADGGIGNVRFVVGLREENPDAILARVFPMTKIIPTEVKEKPKKKKKEKKVEDKVCVRPDCAARKDKLTTMKDENRSLRQKVKALEGRVETVRNKVALTEKSIIMAEEKNDSLNGQIEDAQSKIESMNVDVDKAESFNRTLRNQLQLLQQEIENIKNQTDEATVELQELLEDKTERRIVFSRDPKHRNPQLASEVSVLRFPNPNEDDGDNSD